MRNMNNILDMDWIDVAYDRNCWWNVVHVAIRLGFP